MNGLFLAITLVMSLLALSIVARPLLPPRGRNDKGFALLPLLSVVLVILFAVGMYFSLGRPDAAVSQAEIPVRAYSGLNNTPAATKQKNIGSVGSMLDGLVARLKEEPDDAGGWLLLAKSYKHLGQMDDARLAYDKAAALGKTDSSMETAFGQKPAAQNVAVEIRGRISISANAAEAIDETDTVFIMAKAAGGSPMPLAVVRKRASDLPVDFVLNDEASMVQGMGLSSADKVIVSAKISKSGDAMQIEQGYEVYSGPIDAHNAAFLDLVIDPASSMENLGTSQADSTL